MTEAVNNEIDKVWENSQVGRLAIEYCLEPTLLLMMAGATGTHGLEQLNNELVKDEKGLPTHLLSELKAFHSRYTRQNLLPWLLYRIAKDVPEQEPLWRCMYLDELITSVALGSEFGKQREWHRDLSRQIFPSFSNRMEADHYVINLDQLTCEVGVELKPYGLVTYIFIPAEEMTEPLSHRLKVLLGSGKVDGIGRYINLKRSGVGAYIIFYADKREGLTMEDFGLVSPSYFMMTPRDKSAEERFLALLNEKVREISPELTVRLPDVLHHTKYTIDRS